MSKSENELDSEKLAQINGLGQLVFLKTTPSTNTFAAEMCQSDQLQLPALIVAESQTAGRGQFQRRWNSSAGSLTFSIALQSQPKPHLPILAGKSIAESLRTIFLNQADRSRADAARFKIKWPNDLVFDRMKLGGILVESIPNRQQVVIGVGLNINNELPDLDRADSPNKPLTPTNLASIIGKEISLTNVLFRTATGLLDVFRASAEAGLSNDLIGEIDNLLAFREQRVQFQVPDGTIFQGQLLGVSRTGALRIDTADGELEFVSGQLVSAPE